MTLNAYVGTQIYYTVYHDNNEHFISLPWHPLGICNVHFPSGNGELKEFEKIQHTCDIDMFFVQGEHIACALNIFPCWQMTFHNPHSNRCLWFLYASSYD